MKKVYERPAMSVETFEATQSVAASCGMSFEHDPISMDASTVVVCKCGTNGHRFAYSKVASMDANGDQAVTLFNSGACEMVYESYPNVAEIGKILSANGNSSWSSTSHALVIEGVKIPSV